MESAEITLTLFFTKRVGLKTWAEVGMIDRELALYRKLSMLLKRVNMVTYGGSKDKAFSDKLRDIKILPVTWRRIRAITILHLLMKYRSEIKKSDILKTNQIQGSEIPLWFKKKFGKKLIVRCGYLYSQFRSKQTDDEVVRRKAYKLEQDVFSSADMGVVTSPRDRDYVIAEYKTDPMKIKVIPNYVVTDIFKPIPEISKKYDLLFIGRYSDQKNLESLLQAINYLKTENHRVSLILVGRCCYDSRIKQIIDQFSLDITLRGTVPNFELPQIINQARLFILPSYYEGHPKTLLEAMSCGIPCIGTDVTGIRDDIDHLFTGYLCKTDFKSIADAIKILLSDEILQAKLGMNARNYILRNYSLNKIVPMELAIIKEVLES